jgi:hypothetical protein
MDHKLIYLQHRQRWWEDKNPDPHSTPQSESQEPPDEAIANEEKSELLARVMFPRKPTTCTVPCNQEHPNWIPINSKITEEQIR